MPTTEQLAEFKQAFGKLHTEGDQLPDMNVKDNSGNNKKLRNIVSKLRRELRKHVYREHVEQFTTDIRNHLDESDRLTKLGDGGPDHSGAFTELESGRNKAIQAMGYIDKYAKYKVKAGEAVGMIAMLKAGVKPEDVKDYVNTWDQAVKDANLLADTHQYDSADSDIDDLHTTIESKIEAREVRWARNHINHYESQNDKIQTYLATQISELKNIRAKMLTDLAKKDFLQVILGYKLFSGINSVTKSLIPRRTEFEEQLTKTETALDDIESLFDVDPFSSFSFALRKKAAVKRASIKNRQIELALENLKKIESDAITVKGYAPDYISFLEERPKVDDPNPIQGLDRHANKNQEIVDGIKDLLERADLAKQSSIVKFDSTEIDLANKLLQEVNRNIAAAKIAFDASTEFNNIISNVDSASAATDLATLKSRFTTAKNHDKKDAVLKSGGTDKELDVLITQYGDNLSKIQTKVDDDPATAVDDIKSAAADLDEIFIILSLEAGYEVDLKALSDRRGLLDKSSKATIIRSKIDALDLAIEEFTAEHNAREWKNQATKLKVARKKADEAEKVRKLRLEYEKRESYIIGADGTGGRLSVCDLGTTDKNSVIGIITTATRYADRTNLDFVNANKKLDEAIKKMEELYFKKQLNAKDVDNVKTAAENLIKNGSVESLDELIQSIDTGSADKDLEMIAALAEVRFGKALDVEVLTKIGAVTAAKRMMRVMALVPKDIINNPSISIIKREGPNASVGGYYAPGRGDVVATGRPGVSNEKFGANISHQLPIDDMDSEEYRKYLPDNVDKAVDAFDFALLHEVGHAVDDNLGFMLRKAKESAYGSWKFHGSNIDVIVDQVAQKYKVHLGDDHWKQEIKDLLLRKDVTWPNVAPASADLTARELKNALKLWYKKASVDSGQLWYNQADCEYVETPDHRVYQESYKNKWTSYPIEERKKGITGYQFRAPGEWFAELYAAYYIKPSKLKKSHPAVAWLSTLKIS